MSWLLIIGIVVVLFVLFMVSSMKMFRAGARRDFIAYLRAEDPGLRITEHPDRLAIARGDGEPGTMFLHNFYGQMAQVKLSDKEAVRAVFAQFAGMVREATTVQPLDPVRDRARVFPRLVQPDFLPEADANGLIVPHRPYGDTGLFITYVLDSAHSMAHITDKTLAELGLTLDTVHALALDNLRARFKPEIVRGVLERNTMSVVKTADGYDAARLLLVPESLREGEVVAAAVPDRDTLVLAPAPRDGDWTVYRKVARTPAGPPLLGVPLSVTRNGVSAILAA